VAVNRHGGVPPDNEAHLPDWKKKRERASDSITLEGRAKKPTMVGLWGGGALKNPPPSCWTTDKKKPLGNGGGSVEAVRMLRTDRKNVGKALRAEPGYLPRRIFGGREKSGVAQTQPRRGKVRR